MRIGHGYDVHRLTEGRKLILGGVEIENGGIGLLGHSDADVLLHAISDSLLGACALGDIGKHFPDTDEAFKDADSLELLKKVGEIIADEEYKVYNVDATVIAQSPKLSPFIDEMRKNIANALKIRIDQVSVKATTEEKLGFTGTGEGIAAHSVCLVEETKKVKFI
ncbi:MAG: 2-C-methyl-D-erythritol 2,4-cyclodiphosphate synthase [Candidatus Fimenecus sp.]